jgi:hypothetical protein
LASFAGMRRSRPGVGRIELVTPETKRTVEQAIAKNDWRTIDPYGRFLGPILERISSENPLKAIQVQQFVRSIRASFGATPCR